MSDDRITEVIAEEQYNIEDVQALKDELRAKVN